MAAAVVNNYTTIPSSDNQAKTMGAHTESGDFESSRSPKDDQSHSNDEAGRIGDSDKDSSKTEDGLRSKKDNVELEKYWKAVRENCQDFTGWTYLLQFVEQEVFEKGVAAVPLSVDLWLHYLNFYKTQHKDDPDGEEKVRELFEYATAAAGMEFKSDRLWEMYLHWETEQKQLANVTGVYDRLLSTPSHLYSHHFEKFQEFVNNNDPKEIVSAEEYAPLRQDIVNTKTKEDDQEPIIGGETPPPGMEDDAPPGDDSVPAQEKAPQVDEETATLRRKIIESRRQLYKANEEEVSKRWAFEEGIKRPYFHVKPLERAQLKNWRDYLDFEIENGSQDRVAILFERCMIACALYEDLWTKYAKYLETFSEEGARNVYSRACNIHLPKKPNIHMAWAAFEERLGNFTTAWEILDNLERTLPNYLPVVFRRINLERRQGNKAEVEELYKAYIEQAKSKELASHYACKFARYYFKTHNDHEKAIDILREALKKDKENPKLYLQIFDCYYQQFPLNEDAIYKIFDEAVSAELPVEMRILFSQRRLEFYEDFGSDIKRLQELYDEHAKLTKILSQDRKKRGLPDESRGDEGSAEKKAKIEANGVVASAMPTAQTAAAAAATDQTAAAYNYAAALARIFSSNRSLGKLKIWRRLIIIIRRQPHGIHTVN
uniref:Suppressor of forked domain-containing protein n=1 Tax=Strigamia maritima TaxID=126957 RepID=T1JL07_STRMM